MKLLSWISFLNSIKQITNTNSKPLVASSGLSIQYAIMMGLIHDALEKYLITGKADLNSMMPHHAAGVKSMIPIQYANFLKTEI